MVTCSAHVNCICCTSYTPTCLLYCEQTILINFDPGFNSTNPCTSSRGGHSDVIVHVVLFTSISSSLSLIGLSVICVCVIVDVVGTMFFFSNSQHMLCWLHRLRDYCTLGRFRFSIIICPSLTYCSVSLFNTCSMYSTNKVGHSPSSSRLLINDDGVFVVKRVG